MSRKRNKRNNLSELIIFLCIAIIIGISQGTTNEVLQDIKTSLLGITETKTYDIGNIPEYNGKSYITINDNKPNFKEEDKTTEE